MEEKVEKKFFVFQIIVTDLAAANSHYYKENTCHRQSMCQQTVLRLHTSLEDTFSNSISPRVMKKYDKSVVVQIWDPSTCWLSKGVLKWAISYKIFETNSSFDLK